MSRRRILIVEDESMLAMLLSDRLTSEGYSVETAGDGSTGWSMASAGTWDLVILDVMLPGMDGFKVCETLRAGGVTTPILMLTARGDVQDRVAGLRIGADDYLPKPFDVGELLARIEALMRRHVPASQDTSAFGPVTVDRLQKTVLRGGVPVELSFKEFRCCATSSTGRIFRCRGKNCFSVSGAISIRQTLERWTSTWRNCGANWKRIRRSPNTW